MLSTFNFMESSFIFGVSRRNIGSRASRRGSRFCAALLGALSLGGARAELAAKVQVSNHSWVSQVSAP